MKGKESQAKIIPFGEKVLYKREKPKGRKNKMEERFSEGIWAGITPTTNEIVILTENGPKRTRTIRRLEEGDKYDLELLNRVVGKPIPEWKEIDEKDNEHDEPITCEPADQADEEPDKGKEPKQVRRWRIKQADIDKYGPTPGCIGCRAMKAGLPQQGHDEKCRKRMEELIGGTEEGKERLKRSNERINQKIADTIEKEDKKLEDLKAKPTEVRREGEARGGQRRTEKRRKKRVRHRQYQT